MQSAQPWSKRVAKWLSSRALATEARRQASNRHRYRAQRCHNVCTGDLGYEDDQGNFHFVGRKKDALPRRGENVPAWEVEHAIRKGRAETH
jgi:acyl-coenzyme A synthetase/AMP-(fatty) acid ligase